MIEAALPKSNNASTADTTLFTRRSLSRLALVVFLAPVLGSAAVACGPARNHREKILRLGVLGPFTGPSARTGTEFKCSVRMAFEAIGQRIGDYNVELLWIDSQSDPQKASTAYEEAVIRGKIEAGCLNWNSSVAAAVMEITAKYKVPHFFGMGATGVVNEKYRSNPAKYGYWMAKGWPTPSKLTLAYVHALEDAIQRGLWKPESRRAAIWGEDTDWGRSLGGAIRDQLKAASWTVASEEYFRLTETDYYPLLRKLKDADVALLAGSSTAPSGISAFIKQAREVGIKSLIVADGLGWVGEWHTLTGDASDFVIDQIPGWVTPRAKQFAAAFEKRWGLKPGPAAAGLSYDYANFFIKIANRALERFGTIDRSSLYKVGQEELMAGSLVYTGGIIMKEYRYTPETAPDPVVGERNFIFPVLQYRHGQSRVIWPEVWKEGDLELPGPVTVMLLEVRDVTRSFGGLKALRGVSLKVAEGEIFGLIGPNGAGKTTLLNVIAGVHRPDTGSVRLLDKDITGQSPNRVCRSGVSRTFQIPPGFSADDGSRECLGRRRFRKSKASRA